MPSAYPGALDALTTASANATPSTDTHPALHNNANAAINAIQSTLGTNPQGSEASVAARIAALEGGGSGLPNPFTVARATRQSAAPSAAAAGETKFQFRDAARAALLEMITDVGDPILLLPGFTDPLVSGWWIESNQLAYKSMASALSTDGTATQSTIANTIGAQNYATTASANTGAGLYSTSALYRDGSSVGDGGLFWGLFSLPDASYGSGATGSKVVVGLHDTVAHNGSRPGGNGVLFEYNTNQSDTNWQFIVSDGGVDTIVDTGLAFAAQTTMFWLIHIPRGGSACYGYISKVGVGSAAAVAGAMPSNTAMYYLPARLSTLSATVRNIRAASGFMRHGGAL